MIIASLHPYPSGERVTREQGRENNEIFGVIVDMIKAVSGKSYISVGPNFIVSINSTFEPKPLIDILALRKKELENNRPEEEKEFTEFINQIIADIIKLIDEKY